MPKTGRPPTPIDIELIRALTEQGWRLNRIAIHIGVSRNVVWGAMKRAGIPRHDQHSNPGQANPAWKGGRQRDGDGYWLIWSPEHPHATKAGYVREHRLVMEQKLGRYLLPSEVVHHIDADKGNNDPSNLEVFQRNADHLRAELTGRVPNWTPEGRARTLDAVRNQPRHVHSLETRQRMSEAQKRRGPRGPLSAETRAKISAAHRRRRGL